jgi:hypothetical protein
VRVSAVDLLDTPRGTRAVADVRLDDGTRWPLWIEVPGVVAPEQAHDAMFHPALHPVPVEVSPRPAGASPQLPPDRGVASCFTGGVDSLYSAVTALEVRYALFVQGFDVSLQNTRRLRAVTSRLRRTSRPLGLQLLVARSNLVEHTRGTVEWGAYLHGAALAAVGMLTAARAHTLLVPSSGSSAYISAPNGSHHALDGLHDTEYRQGGLNCGVVRTQLELESIGAEIRRAAHFDVSPTREQLLAMVVVSSPKSHRILASTRDFAARQGADDIVAGLTRHLRRYEFQQARAQLVASLTGARPAELRRLSSRLRRTASTSADGLPVEMALPPELRRERRRLRMARGAATPAA